MLRLRELRGKMRQSWDVLARDVHPREMSVRGTVPRGVEGRGGNTRTRVGLGRTETRREGVGIAGTPIPGSGLPRINLEPGGKGIEGGGGTGRGTVLVRDGGQDVV